MEKQARPPLVCAVVLNWNRKSDALECADSLLGCSYCNLRVIIVDNASRDGSMDAFRKEYGRNKIVSLISNRTNGGYVANNLGIGRALEMGAKYALIINNDATIEKGALGKLVATAEKMPQAAIVAPLIVQKGDRRRVWSAGTDFNNWIFKASLMGVGDDASRYGSRREIPLAVGAAILVRCKAIGEVGLLDEKYFAYYEETKWEILMKRAGWKIVLEPWAVVLHAAASSSGGGRTALSTYYLVRNRGWLIYELCPFYLKPVAYPSLVAEAFARAVQAAIRGDGSTARASIGGLADFLKGRSGKRDLGFRK